jgi:hypothetical protein
MPSDPVRDLREQLPVGFNFREDVARKILEGFSRVLFLKKGKEIDGEHRAGVMVVDVGRERFAHVQAGEGIGSSVFLIHRWQ